MSEANSILPFGGWMLFIYTVMGNFLLHLVFQCAEILALPANQLLWNSVSLLTVVFFLEIQKNIKPSLMFSDAVRIFDWFFLWSACGQLRWRVFQKVLNTLSVCKLWNGLIESEKCVMELGLVSHVAEDQRLQF